MLSYDTELYTLHLYQEYNKIPIILYHDPNT